MVCSFEMSLSEELQEAVANKIEFLKLEVKRRSDQLNALNPRQVLNRGYSISTTKDGKVIKTVKDVQPGQEIITSLNDGTINSTVNKVEE